MSWDQNWSAHARKRIADAFSAAAAVLIAVEDKRAYVWANDLPMIDNAIRDLQKAKEIHLARLKEHDKEKAA